MKNLIYIIDNTMINRMYLLISTQLFKGPGIQRGRRIQAMFEVTINAYYQSLHRTLPHNVCFNSFF